MVTSAQGIDISELLIGFRQEVYMSGTDTGTLLDGIYKFNPDAVDESPSLYTDNFKLSKVRTLDKCTYFAQSGPSLQDVVELKIYEPLDIVDPDLSKRNPRLIASGLAPMKGGSFVDDEFYFNLDSLPYKGPDFNSLSTVVDVYNFYKCGNRIVGVFNDSATGQELAMYRPDLPLSTSNPGLLMEVFSGVSSGVSQMFGCGVDNEIYFTGRIDGDLVSDPVSLFKYNPYAAPGINNPRKINGATMNYIKSAMRLP